MDMDIDTKTILDIIGSLQKSQKSMLDISHRLSQDVRIAGNSLEGKQYSLSVQETEASSKIIESTTENIKRVAEYLTHLEAIVNNYLECTYDSD